MAHSVDCKHCWVKIKGTCATSKKSSLWKGHPQWQKSLMDQLSLYHQQCFNHQTYLNHLLLPLSWKSKYNRLKNSIKSIFLFSPLRLFQKETTLFTLWGSKGKKIITVFYYLLTKTLLRSCWRYCFVEIDCMWEGGSHCSNPQVRIQKKMQLKSEAANESAHASM